MGCSAHPPHSTFAISLLPFSSDPRIHTACVPSICSPVSDLPPPVTIRRSLISSPFRLPPPRPGSMPYVPARAFVSPYCYPSALVSLTSAHVPSPPRPLLMRPPPPHPQVVTNLIAIGQAWTLEGKVNATALSGGGSYVFSVLRCSGRRLGGRSQGLVRAGKVGGAVGNGGRGRAAL